MRCVPPGYLLAVFIAVGLPPITLLNKCFCQVHGNKHKVVNIQLHKAESEKNVCHPAELRDRQPGRREVPLLFGHTVGAVRYLQEGQHHPTGWPRTHWLSLVCLAALALSHVHLIWAVQKILSVGQKHYKRLRSATSKSNSAFPIFPWDIVSHWGIRLDEKAVCGTVKVLSCHFQLWQCRHWQRFPELKFHFNFDEFLACSTHYSRFRGSTLISAALVCISQVLRRARCCSTALIFDLTGIAICE